MAEHLVATIASAPGDAWLAPEAELDAYEGIRQGDESAFCVIAEPLHPVLRRLAALHVPTGSRADEVAVRTWAAALRGLDMFRWDTPFATWVAGITIAFSRTHDAAGPAPPSPRTAPPHQMPGPPDWSDLPWGARWQDAWTTLACALIALPSDQREVVHACDVEQWPGRRACDVLALPEVAYGRLLDEGRARLRDALALAIGQAEPGPHQAAQTAATSRMLGMLRDVAPVPLDARTVAVFRRWQRSRQSRWRCLSLRRRHPSAPSLHA